MPRRQGRYIATLRNGTPAQFDLLVGYLRGDRTVEYTSRQGPRQTFMDIFVRPFNIPLPTGMQLVQRVNEPRFEDVSTFFTGFVTTTLPAEMQVRVNGIRTPRAVVTTGRNPSGEPETSQLTGRRYLNYGGQSVAVPFGTDNAADPASVSEVFEAIAADVAAAAGNNTVALVPGSTSIT